MPLITDCRWLVVDIMSAIVVPHLMPCCAVVKSLLVGSSVVAPRLKFDMPSPQIASCRNVGVSLGPLSRSIQYNVVHSAVSGCRDVYCRPCPPFVGLKIQTPNSNPKLQLLVESAAIDNAAGNNKTYESLAIASVVVWERNG